MQYIYMTDPIKTYRN